MKTLVYTFRTFPYPHELNSYFPDFFVLGKLKADLQNFCNSIKTSNPDFILGIANSNLGSYFEPLAINQFNKSSKIRKNGLPELKLFIPELTLTNFKISLNPSSSFCNYSMYTIQHFLEDNNLKIPFAFVHLSKEHMSTLTEMIQKQHFHD